MAALIRHGLLAANPLKSASALLAVNTANVRLDITRLRHSKKIPKNPYAKFEAQRKSLADKGFLRPQKAYSPPDDVMSRVNKICEEQGISVNENTKLEDPLTRFKLFVACQNDINHVIPNSLLSFINTVGDLQVFYKTPVNVKTPLDALRNMDLPKNLHIRYDYHRFHPNTDTLFNGKTAFPKSSTIVTGLKYKKKYPGHKQDSPYESELLRI